MKGLNGRSLMMVLLLAQLLLVLALWPGARMERVASKEQAVMRSVMGEVYTDWTYQRAGGWYQDYIVASGFREATYDMLLPTERQRRNSRGMETMGQGNWFPFVESRLNTFFTLIHQVFVRLSLVSAWAPYLLILVLPALWDGMMLWRARQTGFYFNSPMVHRYSLRSMALAAWALVALLFWPTTVNPLLVPALLALIAWSAGNVATHMPKRL